MDPVVSRILSLLKKGAATAAIAAAADYARRNPRRAACYEILAYAEESTGYHRAAIQSISQAILLDAREPAYRVQRARLNLRIGRIADALADLDRAEEADDPGYAAAAARYRAEAQAMLAPPPRRAGQRGQTAAA